MTLSTTALAHDDAPKLAAALQRAKIRIQELEQENSALHHEIRWIDKLLAVPASIMSPSHKVTLRAAVKAYQQGTPDENGLVQIESWKLCKTVGQSRQTFLENLTYCTERLGILTKKRERLVDSDTNDYTTNLSIGVTPLMAHPHQYKVETPRNHGGERQLCPHCHSDRLQRKVTIICMHCGSVLDEKISLVNQRSHLDDSPHSHVDQAETAHVEEYQKPAPDTHVNLTPIKTTVLEPHLDDSAALLQQEPPTPLVSDHIDHDEQYQGQEHLCPVNSLSQADLLTHAAQLLVEIAGPEPVHIEMSDRGPKKYYAVKRAITEQDARNHLKGWKTKGASLRRPAGMTRALCYDADTPQDWEYLRDAAQRLSEAGYHPIVEDSPVRGGHLWIIYTHLVNATAAHQYAAQVAPMLQQFKESWPGPGPNKVRLPGGKYVKPGFATWCQLHDAHGGLIAQDGQSAARVLLIYQTCADLVMHNVNQHDVPQQRDSPVCLSTQAATEEGPCGISNGHTSQPATVQQEKRSSRTLHIAPGVDHHWQQKYSQQLWFHFTPAQLADWYNERNRVEDILPPEMNGMGLASWRGEHTASVGLREDGWVDFGASARRADGKQDGGDALDLTVRVNQEAKPEVMRELARQLVGEAREAVESAAHCGEQPPQWVQAFMSPAGWEHYHHLRAEAGSSSQAFTTIMESAPHIGGGTGCASPDHDAPASQTCQTHPDQEQRQVPYSVQAVPASNPMQAIAMLEAIKAYGQASAWAALLIDGEEIIPAGRSNWLHFVWLSQQQDQQRRVYAYIQDRNLP
jgi:transcription initiation factor TFIIIB Brf1 subunit/transcription initiation factor TFIIB